MHTRWCFKRIVGHSFRIGGASVARLDGHGILSVRYAGQWSKRSRALMHYTRMNLVSMQPEQIYKEVPCYNKKWSHQILSYIARNVVQNEDVTYQRTSS